MTVYVVATAGHVDHGKSTLMRRLTGMEPDRLAEERRRGLTIDLGFAWTDLPSGEQIAFVDVPGHERFVPTMLAGAGPVPAVLFVVAADEGWMAQSAEHLAALSALGVEHGLLVVTRSDLADPEPARAQALARLAETSLTGAASVAVSGHTGAGLDDLRHALGGLVRGLPAADPDADVRLWVDRSFSVAGAGTVVTGTLRAGTLRVGDELEISGQPKPARVRGLQVLGEDQTSVSAVARVAVNLRGIERDAIGRGDTLLAPGAWLPTETVDVALSEPVEPRGTLVLHLGSAGVPVRLRLLDKAFARLTLDRPLPLRVGDRGLLRDPGRRQIVAGVQVLDVRPPALRRRGAARDRAEALARAGLEPARLAALHLSARGFVQAAELRAMGLSGQGHELPGGWLADPAAWSDRVARAPGEVDAWLARNPLAAGVPADIVRQRLSVPTVVLRQLVEAAGLVESDGRIGRTDPQAGALPQAVERAVRAVEADLAAEPFAAPNANRLAELGLGSRELAAAVRVGRLTAIGDGLVLLPDAPSAALQTLASLPQPFTLSQARQALRTTRRVAVPLLELLDRLGHTQRLDDGTHRLR
ncbi:selenocysteine-specific translation elongation factor [Flindersiella endophytica]